MSDAIFTRTSKVWLDEDLGIVVAEALPGAKQTLTDATENLAAVTKISGGKRRPLLVDLSGSLGLDYDARTHYGAHGSSAYCALALVGSTPVSRMIANMFFAVQRNKECPSKFFSAVPEAIEWLKQLAER